MPTAHICYIVLQVTYCSITYRGVPIYNQAVGEEGKGEGKGGREKGKGKGRGKGKGK